MTDEALEKLWKTYQDAWADISPKDRRKLFQASVAHDVVYTDMDGEEHGIDNLAINIAAFQTKSNGCYFRSTILRQQHGQLISAWTMFDRDDAQLVNAHSYARFDEQQGQLIYLAGFWKL